MISITKRQLINPLVFFSQSGVSFELGGYEFQPLFLPLYYMNLYKFSEYSHKTETRVAATAVAIAKRHQMK